jgi:DNA transposition AAA+ family ATPase
MVTNELKIKIIRAVNADRTNFESDSKHSTKLGINKGIYSLLKSGKTERVLSDGEWIRIGRLLDVSLNKKPEWKTAQTPVFKYITSQLQHCQQESTSGLFCDECDVGKTHAAKVYAASHRNVVYVDCSQLKTKQKFIRYIASQFGVDSGGKLVDVIADMVYYIKTLENPLIILDEAGDLDYPAFLEIKALWNHLEDVCGSYMLGAEALEAKMKRAMRNKKVGYAEIFSRYGARFQHLIPTDLKQKKEFKAHQAQMIIAANLPGKDHEDILAKSEMSLRRIKTMVSKIKTAA